MLFPKRAVHLDFHTMPSVDDVGMDFDPDEFADTLMHAHVDYITVFAKCNLGFTYYPTDVGVEHPGLQRELLGPMISACHERDIRVAAYLNTGIDHEHAFRHRDWCKLNARGQVYDMERMGSFFRTMCLNTAYRDYQLGLISEILDRYPVDGIFLDCFTLTPCYGAECVVGMAELGWDAANEMQARRYCRRVTEDFTADVKAVIAAKRSDIFLYFNGLPFRDQPTHLELEILPTGGWGYDFLTWNIRYARTVDRPYFTMTGRFHKSWGDFGGLRPKESLLFDCLNSIANGGTCSVGDHMHPRGRLNQDVYSLIGEVYETTKQLEPWTDEARSVAEIAVIEPGLGSRAGGDFDRDSIAGASRMLIELKQQFDVLDASTDFDGYRVLIFPDHVVFDADLAKRAREHLDHGGSIICSGASGLDESGDAFALMNFPAVYNGPEEHDPSFFVEHDETAHGLPGMPITIYSPGISMDAATDATILANLHEPYFNAGSWDWRHENVYLPPRGDCGRPVLVELDRVFHFSFPIFKGYFKHAVVQYRSLLGTCLERTLPMPMVRIEGLPSFGQAAVTLQAGRSMVHLLCYVPEHRGESMQIVEEPITATSIRLSLRTDDRQVRRVYLAPEVVELPFECRNGYIEVAIPEIRGYAMVVFEGHTAFS